MRGLERRLLAGDSKAISSVLLALSEFDDLINNTFWIRLDDHPQVMTSFDRDQYDRYCEVLNKLRELRRDGL